jgi:lipocalin-like protein
MEATTMLRMFGTLVFLCAVSTATLGQSSLIGTYRLVSQTLEIEGTPTENFGKAPRGYLMLTPTRVLAFITAETRTPGTAVPDKAALLDTLAGWSGRYRIEGQKLIMSIDASWNESWTGKDQIRTWHLSGNRLTLLSDPIPFARDPSKTVVVRTVWERLE